MKIAADSSHFYAYSKEHLSGAFPLVNENEIESKEKASNKARWKTTRGFDNLQKSAAHNQHPKKPHPSVIQELKHSYAG